MALSPYRDYDVQESSFLKNISDIRLLLESQHPSTEAMTLFLQEYDIPRLRDIVQTKPIIVVCNLGPTNPFEPSTRKEYRILSFRVEFKNLSNREHIHVVNVLKEQFKPSLSYKLWNPNNSDDFNDYTELTPGWIQDLRDGQGYNGNDGRYVLPFSVDVRFPRLII